MGALNARKPCFQVKRLKVWLTPLCTAESSARRSEYQLTRVDSANTWLPSAPLAGCVCQTVPYAVSVNSWFTGLRTAIETRDCVPMSAITGLQLFARSPKCVYFDKSSSYAERPPLYASSIKWLSVERYTTSTESCGDSDQALADGGPAHAAPASIVHAAQGARASGRTLRTS